MQRDRQVYFLVSGQEEYEAGLGEHIITPAIAGYLRVQEEHVILKQDQVSKNLLFMYIKKLRY